MKTPLLILLACLCATPLLAQPGSGSGGYGSVGPGGGGGGPTNGQTQAQVATLIASTNNAMIQPKLQIMSTSGGNEYTDMRASTNPLPSALGVSFTASALGYDLWAASAAGYGSNVWGVPFRIPGGLLSSGNPFWQDLPNYKYLDTSFYWGMGPLASMRTNAWPNGQTNASVQPGFRIVNGNPFSGIAWLDTRTTFTNSAHGDFVGTNYDGVSMYLPGFGLQQGMLSDAYGNPNPVTGIIDQIGKYSQEAPSYQLGLLNDPSLNLYISENAHRTGDPSYGGQAPLMAIETDHFLEGDNEVIVRFPIQRGGVWDVRQAGDNAPTNWLDAFSVDEKTSGSVVSTTNSLLQTSNVISSGTVTANSFVGKGLGLTNLVTAPSAGHTNIVMENSSGVLIPYDLTSLPSGGSQTPWASDIDANAKSLFDLIKLDFGNPQLDFQQWSLVHGSPYGSLLTSITTNGGTAGTGGLQTDFGLFNNAVIVTNNGVVSAITTNSITSPTITSPNFVGNGAGLTNMQSTNVVGLLPIGVLGANSHLKTDSITNLIGSEDATGYTNTVWYTNYLATTNVPIVFNYPASLCQGKITNGPDVFITFGGGDRGSWSFRVKTNVTLHLPPQISWLTGSNSVITNGVLSFTACGGTNDVEASMRENQ